MRMELKWARVLVLFFASVGTAAMPQVVRAAGCTSPMPPARECGVRYCLTGDNSWEYRPKALGVSCGTDLLGYCDGLDWGECVQPARVVVTPLYMISDVRYMPPAFNSSISYTSVVGIGTATSVSSSFTRSNGVAVAVAYSSGLGGASASVSLNDSYTNGRTDSVSVVRQLTHFDTMTCVAPNCADIIDHRNDAIVLLSKPRVNLAIFSGSAPPPADPTTGKQRSEVAWGLDVSGVIQKSLLVGWLNRTIPWPDGTEDDLQTNFGIFPSEYPKILTATGYGYDYVNQIATVPGFSEWVYTWKGNWRPDPNRFQYFGHIDYTPTFPGSSGTTISVETSSSSEIDHSTSYSVSAEVTGSTGFGGLGVALAASSSWTWTNNSSVTTSYGSGAISGFSVNRPQAGYDGPQNVFVFVDRLYQSFMFSYCPGLPELRFMANCANSAPIPDMASPDFASGLVANAAPAQSPISVSWTPVMGATSYALQRSTSAASGFAPVTPAKFNGFSFADTGVTTSSVPYYYKVKASNATGTGNDSSVAVIPAAPTNLTAQVSGSTVNLAWNVAAEATGYAVWRSVNTNVAFAKLSGGTPLTTWLFTDSVPPAGSKYLYAVTASSGTGSSAYSNQIQVLAVPATPTGVAASAGDKYIYLRWSAAAGATNYSVERSMAGSPFATFTGSTNLTTTYVNNTGLINGVTYSYRVKAVNTTGPSAYSAVVLGMPKAPPPPPPSCSCQAGYSCKCGDDRCYSTAQHCP